jgi:hypothetical protein
MAIFYGAERQQNNKGSQPDLIWLDYLIMSNPQGVMKVLNNHGYTGYLAPMDEDELTEVAYEFIDKNGDQAVIELLKTHPLYDVIAGISKEESSINVKYKNALGEEGTITTTLRSINYVKVIEAMLIVIGAVYLADLVWKKFLNPK